MGGLISLAGDESKTSSAGRLMTMLPSMPAMPASRALVHTSLASGPPWLVPAMVDHQRAMGQGRSSGPMVLPKNGRRPRPGWCPMGGVVR
jgi:hypothetical protein